MKAKLLHVFHQIEKERAILLKEISGVSDEKYYFIPAPGKWSVAQILTHILTAERMSLAYMKKKALGINTAGDAGILEPLKLVILKISQRLPFRFKAPKRVIENTPSPLPLSVLEAEWQQVRDELKQFLEHLEDAHVNRKIYKHPVAGRLNIRQAMEFFNEHVQHHWPQVRRLL
jgi:hypothetical protein